MPERAAMTQTTDCRPPLAGHLFGTVDKSGQFRATGYETPKYRGDEVESTYGLSFGVS